MSLDHRPTAALLALMKALSFHQPFISGFINGRFRKPNNRLSRWFLWVNIPARALRLVKQFASFRLSVDHATVSKFAKKVAEVFGVKKPSPVRITMRSSQDVPQFLKKFDAIQKRTAQSALQFKKTA